MCFKFFTTAIFLIWVQLARAETLLQCLGREEAQFHKLKIQNHLYKLNRRMIDEITGIPQLKLSAPIEKRICERVPKLKASLSLLEFMIARGKEIFVIPELVDHNPETIVQHHLITDFVLQRSILALDFLEMVQTEAPDAHCLERNYPQLYLALSRFKSLQEDLDPNVLDEELRSAFLKTRFFKTYSAVLKKCQLTKK